MSLFSSRGETILTQMLSKQCLSEREPRDTRGQFWCRDLVRSPLLDVPTATLAAPWKTPPSRTPPRILQPPAGAEAEGGLLVTCLNIGEDALLRITCRYSIRIHVLTNHSPCFFTVSEVLAGTVGTQSICIIQDMFETLERCSCVGQTGAATQDFGGPRG